MNIMRQSCHYESLLLVKPCSDGLMKISNGVNAALGQICRKLANSLDITWEQRATWGTEQGILVISEQL